nr:phage tail protein [Salmonella enterica]
MASEFFTILTAAGRAKIAAALAEQKQIVLQTMVVGDGNGKYVEPSESQTKVEHEVWRGQLNTLKIAPENPAWVIAEAVLPEAVGGWYVREVGLLDKDGVLIAIGKFPETYKPKLPAGASKQIVIRAVMEVTNAAAVTLMVDPSLVMATVEYVDLSIEEHEKSHNHPDATLTQKGFTQLNSSTNSTLETQAATPKAVKAAMDKANEALEKAGADKAHKHAWGDITGVPDGTLTQKGVVKLNNATNSTSTTEAATPSAVKAAYDLANGKAAGNHKHPWGDITDVPDGTTAQKGVVKLNSATNSTSTTEAATPSAVKAAYDKASAAISSFALFTSNGTFTVPTGVTKVMVEMIGGGAGGAAPPGSSNTYVPCPGGCAAQLYIGIITVTPGSNISIVIGAGGLGAVSAGPYASIKPGTPGGSSKFGDVIATGGIGTYVRGAPSIEEVSYGGVLNTYHMGGDGENSPFGSGGKGIPSGHNHATGFGAGGSGGCRTVGDFFGGGNGSSGFVRIWW